MNYLKLSFFLFFTFLFLNSCSSSDDDTLDFRNENCAFFDNGSRNDFSPDNVNAFLFFGLDVYYLFKEDQEAFFEDSSDLINLSIAPETFFDAITVVEDRFSFLVSDLEVLQNSFVGTSVTDGIDLSLNFIDDNQFELIASVNYVATGSPGDIAGIERGNLFSSINGITLNLDNFSELLNLDTYDLDLLTVNTLDNTFTPLRSVTINKIEFTENPILINTIINIDGLKIGYVVYNGFIRGSENELNEVFGNFRAEGVDELILDLRYNGGGSISTAVDLCGMITGQFDNQVLITEQWNCEIQNFFIEENEELLNTRFRNTLTDGATELNSLNLNQVYIISSENRTASSSELVINGLNAYIDVIHIGSPNGTVGKSQASITLYDSPSLTTTEDINTAHSFAMQPLVFTSANNNGDIVSNNGLTPDVFAIENIFNLGTLGETSDPLLQAAINEITGNNFSARNTVNRSIGNYVGNSKENTISYQRMYK